MTWLPFRRHDLYLQGATQLHCITLLDNGDTEVGGLKHLFEDSAMRLISGSCFEKKETVSVKPVWTPHGSIEQIRCLTDGGFTELLVCHLVGDVGAH